MLKHVWILSILFLSACTSSNKPKIEELPTTKPVETKFLTADGKVYKVETNVDSTAWADAKIAESNAECWKNVTSNSVVQIPEGADAMTLMAIGMIESNKALASALSNNGKNPCPLSTNSNDVNIAKEENKTRRTEARWSAAPKVLGVVAGTAMGINSQNKNAEVAIAGSQALTEVAKAGLERAGVNTTVNGDNNQVATSSQSADNGSDISESANYDRQVETVSEDEETDEITDAASCIAAGHEVRLATQEEADDPTVLKFLNNGLVSVCSTGGDVVRVTE